MDRFFVRWEIPTAALCWFLVSLLGSFPVTASVLRHEIVVNIPAFELYLYENGVLKTTYPIGVGRIVNPSQLGPTQIINKVHYPAYYPPDWYMRGLKPIPPGPENPVGTRWLGLGFRGYGIHGTNEPDTIGTAASSGCIRMYNHHVEELADRVEVGTTVTFTYETIVAWRDPLVDRPVIRVFPDIYRQGSNTLAAAKAALARIGVADGVDGPAMEALLKEAAGEPRPIPWMVPLYMDGERSHVNAVEYGGRLLLSLEALSRLAGVSIRRGESGEAIQVYVTGQKVDDIVWIGDEPYAPVEEAAAAVGVAVREATREKVGLDAVRLYDEHGRGLGVRAFVDGRWLLLPVPDMARYAGVDVKWDAAARVLRRDREVVFGAELLDGTPHLSHERLRDLLGIDVQWRPGDTVASVRRL